MIDSRIQITSSTLRPMGAEIPHAVILGLVTPERSCHSRTSEVQWAESAFHSEDCCGDRIGIFVTVHCPEYIQLMVIAIVGSTGVVASVRNS